jgi:hypothetical protein
LMSKLAFLSKSMRYDTLLRAAVTDGDMFDGILIEASRALIQINGW